MNNWSIKDVPRFAVANEANLVDVLVDNKVVSSKREAREMIFFRSSKY